MRLKDSELLVIDWGLGLLISFLETKGIDHPTSDRAREKIRKEILRRTQK